MFDELFAQVQLVSEGSTIAAGMWNGGALPARMNSILLIASNPAPLSGHVRPPRWLCHLCEMDTMKRVELQFLLIKSLGCIPLLAGILLFAQVKHGATHPHILAEARFDVAVDEYGVVQSLKHLWRFDEFFSSTVIMEFDEDGDWKLNEKELAAVSKLFTHPSATSITFKLYHQTGRMFGCVATF
ncbi:DUF1007 family protein [Rhizobium cremeum]|uniref:DUF1007 family protein n=1 Tax=Rhizobium cremeum TaxID=2813827 RepID=UPI001FD0AFE5|nr:DUF1007 family protein [Rhizobium cremeum]MCJ7997872.1 DUF1007 family protein [Rhizobium cremeum]MCJ8002965.1 DUF1007 family protein [Rhizobium cremeum]